MPYPSKRKARYNAQKKDKFGRFIKEDKAKVVSEEISDRIEDRITLSNEVDMLALSNLKDSVSASQKRKAHYSGDSRTTKWRRKVESSKVDPKSTLFNFGITVVDKNDGEQEEAGPKLTGPQKELILINSSIELLRDRLSPEMNKRKEGSLVDSYSQLRLMSVLLYFEFRLDGMKMVKASERVSEIMWPKYSKAARARSIMSWVKEYLEHNDLSDHNQGVHAKSNPL